MPKYADAAHLLVGSSNIATFEAEFEQVKRGHWATINKLRLNPSKTREMVSYRSWLNFDTLGSSTLAGFKAIVNNQGHVWHHSLRRIKSIGYQMRHRAHNYELPRKDALDFWLASCILRHLLRLTLIGFTFIYFSSYSTLHVSIQCFNDSFYCLFN